MINSETTVRDVALNVPESTRLFEKLKIDYCCGGNKPLAEACASAGVDVDNVMELLAGVKQSDSRIEGAEDFQNLSAHRANHAHPRHAPRIHQIGNGQAATARRQSTRRAWRQSS